ncbi:MAG TPA: DUF2157 domain-containing protein [bacterium]|nr:DUF2157 domain-containing protein [bacterium]
MSTTIRKRGFLEAAGECGLSDQQAELMWTTLDGRRAGFTRFDVPNVAYYLGALVVMAAMGWFMTTAWERFGGPGILVIATVYAACMALIGQRLWQDETYQVPGGLLVTLAVSMVPLAIYGLERTTGIWPQGDPGAYAGYHMWIRGSWFLMEAGTIAAGLVALRFVRFPFLTFPLAFAFWYMSMDLAPLLLGHPAIGWDGDWRARLWVSVGAGLVMLALSILVDRRTADDYARWGYLFGLLSFEGGLTVLMSSESSWAAYGLVNLALMFAAVLLQRRVFLVFGAIGVYIYLGRLAYVVFKDSVMFPFALTVLGLAIIYGGVLYQRHHEQIESNVRWTLRRVSH